jgi:flagellar hook assembly protein FlgD
MNTRIEIFNLQGQMIKVLANLEYQAGSHEIRWDGKNGAGVEVPSGIYLLKLETDNGADFRKIVVSN